MKDITNNDKNLSHSLPRLNITIYTIGNHLHDIAGQLMVDRRFINSKVSIFSGGINAAINFYKENITPDVLIIEFDSDLNTMMHDLLVLSEVCDVKTRVIIAGKTNDVQLYRELMRHGIAEYLVLPTTPIGLISIISSMFQDKNSAPIAPSVAFIGAMGGVGTSIIAQSVALNLANNYNLDTIFIDMDTSYPLSPLSWSVEENKNINDLLQTGNNYIDDTLLRSCLIRISDNLTLLTGPSEPSLDLDSTYENLLNDMIKSSCHLSDYTIIDVPAGRFTIEKRVALLKATYVVIVTEPTIKGVRNVGLLNHTITKMRPNDPDPFIIFNKIDMPDALHLSTKIIQENADIKPNASIRYIKEIIDTSIGRGVPVASVTGSKQFNDDIIACTNLILGKEVNIEQNESKMFNFLSNVKKVMGI